jgi:hypothetical protein
MRAERLTSPSSHGYVVFVEPATPGGARPTKESDSATAYSPDRATWLPLPSGMGPVTGQMDHSATALVFDELTTDVDRTLDLWGYADGHSTLVCTHWRPEPEVPHAATSPLDRRASGD